MKVTVNMPEAKIAELRSAEAEYFTLSDIVRMAVDSFLESRKFAELKAAADGRRRGSVVPAVPALVAPLAKVIPLPVDTRTELEKMPPEARAQFERTIAARKAERAEAEAQRAESQRTMTIDDLSPEKQDIIRRSIAAEVARIGGGITDAHEVPESRESRESSEDDNGYLVGG